MYLVTIHLPIYLDGPRRSVTTEWLRELVLLRDSLRDTFGCLTVVAPSLPADVCPTDQLLQEPDRSDGIELFPSFDFRCRARHYWARERSRWLYDLRRLVARADVVHAGLDDVFRPISYDGFKEGVRQRRTTVFVQDTDIVLQQSELTKESGWKSRLRARVYGAIYERMCRFGVRAADLSLLKGHTLMSRYGKYARNAKEFQDTSYTSDEIISRRRLEERLASLRSRRPLRLVYCGRLISRKGVDHSLRAVARARELGANVELELIGDGPEREQLAGLATRVKGIRLLGPAPYGPALLRRLGGYDAMLFTPKAEDTPRMIFDGYAAGLPLLAYEIEYVRGRAQEDRCVIPLPRDDPDGVARALQQIDASREQLAPLSLSALEAAHHHSADNWYRRRAEWTFEAAQRRWRLVGSSSAG